MDRFIAFALNVWESAKGDLKSNMDRFIANLQSLFLTILENLKSNMDRFIEILLNINQCLQSI